MICAKVEGVPCGMALAQSEIRPHALRNLSETLAQLHTIPAPDSSDFFPATHVARTERSVESKATMSAR